jgi:hypothetical protein
MARNELGNIEREVASLKHRVDALRANRQEAVDELEQARAARRRILVDGGGDANAADRRVLDQATK